MVSEDLGGDDDEVTCLGNFSQTPEVLDISDGDDDIEQDSYAMIQEKIKKEPVEEEEDFDEKQSDASDLENNDADPDEVEIIGMPLKNRPSSLAIQIQIQNFFSTFF